MQDEQQIHIDYTKGFNEGYIIAQELPQLAERIATVESEAVRLEGFRDGREEFLLEKEKQKPRVNLMESKDDKGREEGKGKEKGDNEIDRD